MTGIGGQTLKAGLPYLKEAAIGLAITFGVMGVINMAHGELMMIGAYTTYEMQRLFNHTPDNPADYYYLVALPASFLVAAAVETDRGGIGGAVHVTEGRSHDCH